MARAIDVAMYLIKQGVDSKPNTYDGNMKLQKMLCFANLISLAENNHPLFNDKVYAFENGLVVENVRLCYKNDYAKLKQDSTRFSPNFTDEEYQAIEIACGIFGEASARELSELTHLFNFWANGYNRSKKGIYKDKESSVVLVDEMLPELDRIRDVIEAYKRTNHDDQNYEVVNGIKFYISPNIELNDDLYEQLYSFSLEADESAYTVCYDEGLVIC